MFIAGQLISSRAILKKNLKEKYTIANYACYIVSLHKHSIISNETAKAYLDGAHATDVSICYYKLTCLQQQL